MTTHPRTKDNQGRCAPCLWAMVLAGVLLLFPGTASASAHCGLRAPGHTGVLSAPTASHQQGSRLDAASDDSGECPHCLPPDCAIAPACGAASACEPADSAVSPMVIPFTIGVPVPNTTVPAGLDNQPPQPPPRVSV